MKVESLANMEGTAASTLEGLVHLDIYLRAEIDFVSFYHEIKDSLIP